ncbi:MAG: DUF2267 domain-containing protein [Alphaproteobacteria bacterium]|nr:DUF2267 domain-containing protein [Alphaproteobacteria bacterium]
MTVPAEYQRARDDFYAFLIAARDDAGLWSTHVTYTMAQGVFQAFRRRLTVEEAITFANMLPVGLRALFIADWDLGEPRKSFDDLDGVIGEVKALRGGHNFSPDSAVRNIARALRQQVDNDRLDRFLASLPEGADRFWHVPAEKPADGVRPSGG